MALYLDTFQTAFNNNTTSKWQIVEMAFLTWQKQWSQVYMLSGQCASSVNRCWSV